MLATSQAYKAAIVADSRRIIPEVVIDLVDPDMQYVGVVSGDSGVMSRDDQVYDKEMAHGAGYMTLEPGRNKLDGSMLLYPDTAQELTDEQGYMGKTLSDAEGAIDGYVELQMRNFSIMQAAAVSFSDQAIDGVAQDFIFTVYSEETVVYQQAVEGNQSALVPFDGFTVYDVTAIRVTVLKWSLPFRFFRLLEIVPGIYESWDGDALQDLDVLQETSLSGMSLPYGTATITADNAQQRFNPYDKNSLFSSIEERQGISVYYKVRLPDGTFERIPVSKYYQNSRGWTVSRDGLWIRFKMVDIIGLVSKRDFVCPATMPTTAEGWIQACLSVLGENFARLYILDGDLGSRSLTVASDENLSTSCGNVIKYVAQAIGAYVYGDSATGKMRFSVLPEGICASLDLDNLSSYPDVDANQDLASLTIQTSDGTEYVYDGTTKTAQSDLSVSNPFIHNKAQADALAAHILSFYGGSILSAKGRGDPSSMVGDMDQLETGFGQTVAGRRYKQQLKMNDGILKDCASEFYLLEE